MQALSNGNAVSNVSALRVQITWKMRDKPFDRTTVLYSLNTNEYDFKIIFIHNGKQLRSFRSLLD